MEAGGPEASDEARQLLGQAVGLLIASGDVDDHTLGTKIAKLLKAELGGAADGDAEDPGADPDSTDEPVGGTVAAQEQRRQRLEESIRPTPKKFTDRSARLRFLRGC